MSSISSISSGSSAWASAGAVRNTRPPSGPDPAKMFAKVDADGSGGVDQAELQSLLDKVSGQAGADGSTSATSAADAFSKFDTDGDGSLSQVELGEGMKSLMPSPSSTVEFAQARGEAGGPPPGGPPPSSDSSASYDPLDTNQDGVVSVQEQAAGDAAQATLESLLKAVDSNQDGELSGGELDTFKQVLTDQLDTALKSMQDGGAGSASTSTNKASASQSTRFDLNALASMVLKEYAAMADSSQQSSASQIRLAA